MANNVISLYKKINNDVLTSMQCTVGRTDFYYTENDTEIKLTFEDSEDQNAFYLGAAAEYWDPNIHNLKIKRVIKITNPVILFSKDGVTLPGNTLGVGVHLYSRTSNFQEYSTLDTDIYTYSSNILIEYEKTFEPSYLKGDLVIEFFIYAKKITNSGPYLADKQGIRLGTIDTFKVSVDGDGSMFPIIETARLGEPLWKLEMSWTDINSDSFDPDSVRLEFNSKHEMYDQIYKNTKSANYLINEIVSSAIAQIIYKSIQDNGYDPEEAVSDSIASVVSYWIKTYEVDTSSFENINYTLRQKTESMLSR